MRHKLFLTALAGLAFAGCASMNEDECMVADWNAIGYQDGAHGSTTGGFTSRSKACAKHGITSDFNAYLAGWDEGVKRYCTPQNGFATGSNGGRYQGVCPSEVETDFLAAYSDGRQLYTLTSALQQIDYEIDRGEDRMISIKHEIEEKELALVLKDTTTEDRVQLLLDIKHLQEERGRLRKELKTLRVDRGYAIDDLEDYRSEISYQYGL